MIIPGHPVYTFCNVSAMFASLFCSVALIIDTAYICHRDFLFNKRRLFVIIAGYSRNISEGGPPTCEMRGYKITVYRNRYHVNYRFAR